MTIDRTAPADASPDVLAAVTLALASLAGRDPASIDPGMRFFEDLSLDSAAVLELLMNLENELGVEFDAESLQPADFETVGALAAFVARQPDQ